MGNTLARWIIRGFVLPILLLVSLPTQAAPVTALTLLVGGISLTADLLQIGGTLVDIFGATQISTQSDDHPLYSLANSSPSIAIAATGTTFDLLLKQTNNVGEFEDDLPVELSGITTVDTANGKTEAWKWKVTIEADINFFSASELDAQGFVQHLFIPHPGLKEKSPAPALNYDLTVTQNGSSAHLLKDSATDSKVHADGSHKDSLNPAELDARWVTPDEFDFFNVHLKASHPEIPEPSTLLLAGTALVGLVIARYRLRPRGRVAVRR